jgi:predicted SAM-dependent methyltransferase
MKLHLGCGDKRLDGYEHVDARAECNPDHVADVMALPFDENSAELVYFSHGLEHIRRPDVMDALGEWRRVLKPGGILRLAMPDFEALSGVYHDEKVHLVRIQGLLWGRQNYNGNTHYCGWDYETLAHTLSEAGYFNICHWFPHRVFPEGYDDFSMCKINGVSVSLNVEAIAK